MLEIVRQAAERVGGVPRLAERIGVTRQAIYQWREVPVDRVRDIAVATGIAHADLRPDLYARHDAGEPGLRGFDRHDTIDWNERQAEALRRGELAAVDRFALADMLDDLSRAARDEVARRLRLLLHRLMKWQAKPERRSLSTIGVITSERARLLARFDRSPRLRVHAAAVLQAAYAAARADLVEETGLALDRFPADCPLTLDRLLDPGFAPDAGF